MQTILSLKNKEFNSVLVITFLSSFLMLDSQLFIMMVTAWLVSELTLACTDHIQLTYKRLKISMKHYHDTFISSP